MSAPSSSDRLQGEWRVERTGGLLPPLYGVRKRIDGDHGETLVGGMVGVPFRVEGLELHYLGPFSGFVDVLEPEGEGFRGRATVFGREFGRFAMIRR